MDTSKEYIKMCEKAKEIQGLWEPVDGDFLCCIDQIYVRKNTDIITCNAHKNQLCWWLPRQDQLQEIPKKKNNRELLMRFTDWVEYQTDYRRESMEQLWLAFVMKERWNKIWNGEGWVLNAQ